MFPVFRDHAAASAALLFTRGPHHGEAIGTFHGEGLYYGSLGGARTIVCSTAMGSKSSPMFAADQIAAAIRFGLPAGGKIYGRL